MITELLRQLVEALDDAGVAHMVTGSFASAYHGEPRATRDLDLVIDADEEQISLVVAAFPSDRFYVGDAVGAVRSRDMFNIIDTHTGWKIDLILRKDRPFSIEELDRRQPATIAGIDTYVATAEDCILAKLEWQLITPSDQQRRDVAEMIVANSRSLDLDRLRRWATVLGVERLLADALDDAFGTD